MTTIKITFLCAILKGMLYSFLLMLYLMRNTFPYVLTQNDLLHLLNKSYKDVSLQTLTIILIYPIHQPPHFLHLLVLLMHLLHLICLLHLGNLHHLRLPLFLLVLHHANLPLLNLNLPHLPKGRREREWL
jgi:hypothetical protein